MKRFTWRAATRRDRTAATLSRHRYTHGDEIRSAALALLTVWGLLACGGLLAVEHSRASLLSFAGATAFLLATRSYGHDRTPAASGALLLLGVVSGFASFPAWIVLIGLSGLALGLTLPSPPEAKPPVLWAATILLAPVFEEVLYRERLLAALGRTLGSSLAIPITSALFAISHLEPWRVLGTGLVGLMLGTAMRASGSLALCIGLHMGLNLAGLTSGVPPVGVSLPPSESAAAGLCVLGVAIVLARKW